jgi:NAD(P)-dependent dehydrogenase (short-subunit alcohol dehydrogenase family)
MARVFITGSADGLGRMAAELLIGQGHQVALHARSPMRAQDLVARLPGAKDIVIGDLSSITQTREVAEQVNRLGRFDAVIHNAGVGHREPKRIETQDGRPWNCTDAYAKTKLHDVLLAFAVARRWSNVLSNALEPGWVPTKMGGSAAPDDMNQAHRTQVWLAVSADAEARVTGRYFYHLKQRAPDPRTRDAKRQDGLVTACERLTGIALPAT